MVSRVTIPRAPIPNNPGAPTIFNEFTNLSKEARLVVNAMDALDALIKNGGTISTPARNLRARSFGFFVAGTSLGWMSMIYDSAGIVSPKMRPDSIPPLSSAADVAKAAIGLLDGARRHPPASASAFPLELAWMSGTAMTLDQYQRLIRSYRARFRAGIARAGAAGRRLGQDHRRYRERHQRQSVSDRRRHVGLERQPHPATSIQAGARCR